MKKFILMIVAFMASISLAFISQAKIVNCTAYLPSALAKAQAILLDNFQKSELRYTNPAVYNLFLEQAPIMFPNYDEIRKREDRTVEAYYRKRTSRALGTGRAYGHTGAHGDSGVLTPSWTTYSDVFAISLKQADNNMYNQAQMLANEFENLFKNFVEGAETLATASLIANRTHVNNATFTDPTNDMGTFNGSTFVYEILQATYWGASAFNTMFGNVINSVMAVNKYTDFTIVCDTVAYAKCQYLSAQGQDNANNLSFQFGGKTFIHAIKLNAYAQALGYTKGFAFAIPSGTIGCLPWIPKQNKAGVDTKIQTYSTMINPYDNQTYAIHNYPVRADGTSTGGYTQDEMEEFEGSLDLAFEYAPLMNAGETPIFAFAIAGTLT
jgi:hypothetical protein